MKAYRRLLTAKIKWNAPLWVSLIERNCETQLSIIENQSCKCPNRSNLRRAAFAWRKLVRIWVPNSTPALTTTVFLASKSGCRKWRTLVLSARRKFTKSLTLTCLVASRAWRSLTKCKWWTISRNYTARCAKSESTSTTLTSKPQLMITRRQFA